MYGILDQKAERGWTGRLENVSSTENTQMTFKSVEGESFHLLWESFSLYKQILKITALNQTLCDKRFLLKQIVKNNKYPQVTECVTTSFSYG